MTNIDFAFYWSIFLKRLPYFVAILTLVLAAGLVVTYTLPPVYEATAKILVESPQIPPDLARSTVPTGAIEQFQIIQEDVLSRQNLLALANEFALYRDTPRASDDDIANDMLARIGIQPVSVAAGNGDAPATVFHISFDAAQPDLAANVVNELVAMILRKDVELRTSRASDTLAFFTQEVARLDGEIKGVDGQILAFKNAHIDALPDSLDFRRNQQSALQQRLLLLDQEAATLHRQQSQLQAHRIIIGDAPATPAQKNLAELRQSLVEQRVVFAEDSPTIKALQARIAALETQVRAGAAAAAAAGPDAAALPADADLELADITDRLGAIAKEQDSIHKIGDALDRSIEATPANAIALDVLERNHQNLQAQYDAAVARLAEASTGQQIELRLKGERLTLIESAVPPQAPVSPKRRLLLVGSVGLALALALAAVVVPELLNKRIRRPVELVDRMNIRPLVTIPYIATGRDRNRRRLVSLVAMAAMIMVPLALLALYSHFAGVGFANQVVGSIVGMARREG